MSTGGTKRTRSERVAALELPPGRTARLLLQLRHSATLVRLGLTLLAIVALWVVVRGWAPPFPYRVGQVPHRELTARVSFEKSNPDATRDQQQAARRRTRYVYVQDPEPLVQLRSALVNQVLAVTNAESLDELSDDVWDQFDPPPTEDDAELTEAEREERFQQFRAALTGQDAMEAFENALETSLQKYERIGLLEQLPPEHSDEGNQDEITISNLKEDDPPITVKVTDVLIGDGSPIYASLLGKIKPAEVADRVFAWLQPRLPTTLTLDLEATERAREAAAEVVEEQFVTYEPGRVLAMAEDPLEEDEIEILRLEYDAYCKQLSTPELLTRSIASIGLISGVFMLCGYFVLRRARHILDTWRQFALLLVCVIGSVALACWMSFDPWRAELLPLLFVGMIFTVAYGRETALLLSAAVALMMVLAIDQSLGSYMVLCGSVAAAVLLLARIRSRSKLIKVGVMASLAAATLTLIAGVLLGQPLAEPLWLHAGFNALWTFGAAFLISGLLTVVESVFDVVTDLTLLELGDVAHPLLQELVRRAPGTYNHSINVASIGEAAADSIGANGLLVRVGAYFHDIGKMFNPGYFIENQGDAENRHESLMPAMSTLIIIAHIKDGADLARQHHLPQSLVDFIMQHHGTTLVEYFFDRAHRQSAENPDAAEVDEAAFRYPGPKPQTQETAILMLADGVESASRVLTEPTPARIGSLVREIAMKRLLDGQFDECGLNLKQLRTIEDCLIKSLTAVYHGRVKYPDSSQRTA